MAEVVGFAGLAGTGKTTSAALLHETAADSTGMLIEFSSPIIEAAQAWLNRFDANALPEHSSNLSQYLNSLSEGKVSKHITAEAKEVHRPLLEWLGTTALRVHGDSHWANMVSDKIDLGLDNGADLITVSGIRSITDANIVRQKAGKVIRVIRNRARREVLPSEANLENWKADLVLDNNGTKEELAGKLRRIWMDVAGEASEHDYEERFLCQKIVAMQ